MNQTLRVIKRIVVCHGCQSSCMHSIVRNMSTINPGRAWLGVDGFTPIKLRTHRTFKHSAALQINVTSEEKYSGSIDYQQLGGVESFAEYGLGVDYFPHHWLQSGMELLHNSLDLGWMPTIAVITIAIRFLAVPTYVKMRQFNARSHNHLPEQMELQASMMSSNPVEKQKKKLELMEFFKKNKLNPLKPLLYSLPTGAIFLSFFAALRGISEAKLPSFVAGGLLWFPDLTIPDPYYILPLLSCASLHFLIRFGAASAELGAAENVPFLKKFLLWSPIAFYPFLIFQPACMFVFWITSNLFSMFLMLLFSKQSVRTFCGIPEQIRHSAAAQETLKKKMSFSSMMKEAKKQAVLREAAMKKVNNHIGKMNEINQKKKR